MAAAAAALLATASPALAGEVIATLRDPEWRDGALVNDEEIRAAAASLAESAAERVGGRVVGSYDALTLACGGEFVIAVIANDELSSEELAAKLKEQRSVLSARPKSTVRAL